MSIFRAGGLASGLDTNTIVEQLTEIQRIPLNKLSEKQEAFKIQLSGIGRIMSALEALGKAAAALSDDGLLATKTTTETSGFSVVPTSNSPVGTYDLQVDALARAAKARSDPFSSPTDQVRNGTVTIGVDGTDFDIVINDGDTLADVAFAINQSDAPVSASIINDGTSSYLSLTRTETGHVIGDNPDTALDIRENYQGGPGQRLRLAVTQEASNAQVSLDGLAIERRSNTFTDLIAGTEVTLQAITTSPEQLVINRDIEGTEENLQKFIDAYNSVNELIQGDLDVQAETDRTKTLAGDPAVRLLQRRLQNLVTTEIAAAGSDVRTLADMGIRSARDGTLSINATELADAIGRDEGGVAAIFAGMGGISDSVEALVELQTDSVDGLLSQRKDGIQDSIDNIDLELAQKEVRIEAYTQGLIAKFIAMEEIIASMQATGNYLSNFKFPEYGGEG